MRYDRSEQEKLDRIMCKPGYTWNKTLKRCLAYGSVVANEPVLREKKKKKPQIEPQKPEITPDNSNSADAAVNAEVSKRTSA